MRPNREYIQSTKLMRKQGQVDTIGNYVNKYVHTRKLGQLRKTGNEYRKWKHKTQT